MKIYHYQFFAGGKSSSRVGKNCQFASIHHTQGRSGKFPMENECHGPISNLLNLSYKTSLDHGPNAVFLGPTNHGPKP
jgi:hypothetical protein